MTLKGAANGVGQWMEGLRFDGFPYIIGERRKNKKDIMPRTQKVHNDFLQNVVKHHQPHWF